MSDDEREDYRKDAIDDYDRPEPQPSQYARRRRAEIRHTLDTIEAGKAGKAVTP